MRTVKITNKLISFIIVMAVLLCLFAVMPKTVYAATTADLVNQIKNFDPGPGSTGKLDAFIITGRGIVVSGTVTDATKCLGLDIDNDVRIIWSADYSGSNFFELIELTGDGIFEVASGGSIKNNRSGGDGITSHGTTVTISGGSVSAKRTAIMPITNATTINVSGGTVSGAYAISDGLVGSGHVINISGGTLNATADGPAKTSAINCIAKSTLNMTGGAVIGNSSDAICLNHSDSTVKVSGGFVFGSNPNITGTSNAVIIMGNGNTPTIIDTAVVCGWNKASGTMTYTEGKKDNLIVNSGATAQWDRSGVQSGIRYSKGENTGFFPISGVTVNLAAPSGLTAAAGASGITLNWTDNSNRETGYIIERKANGGGWGQMDFVGVNATTYTDINVQPDVLYTYKVNATGEGFYPSAYSNEASAMIVTEFSVKFDTNGGGAVVEQTVHKGDKAVQPTDPVKTDSAFAGWYKDAGLSSAYNFNDPVTADITLYAKWTDPSSEAYAVTVTAGGGGTANSDVASAKEGDTVTLTVTENEGYMFKQWQVLSGGAIITGDTFVMPANAVAIRAVFEPVPEANVSSAEGLNKPDGMEGLNEHDSADDPDGTELDGTPTQGSGGAKSSMLLWIMLIVLVTIAAGGAVTVIIIARDKKQRANENPGYFCGNCGTKAPAGAKFCANCGGRITGPPEQEPVPQEQVRLEQTPQEPVPQEFGDKDKTEE